LAVYAAWHLALGAFLGLAAVLAVALALLALNIFA
jgi:hypothetical protein